MSESTEYRHSVVGVETGLVEDILRENLTLRAEVREWKRNWEQAAANGVKDSDRADNAEAALAKMRQDILVAFPLFDAEGLNEVEHHCEWALLQDRTRLHILLTEGENQGNKKGKSK